MLALAYAGKHPDEAACLALVGCGTFDLASRARVDSNRKERMCEDGVRRANQLAEKYSDRDQRFLAMGSMMQRKVTPSLAQEHKTILQMALDRNVESALQAMEHHITQTIDTNIQALKKSQQNH